MALRCLGWVVAHASVVMRWLGTGELRGPTGAIVPSPDVAGGALPVDLWATQVRCPQIHRHCDHNLKAIFHLVAPDPITPYPPQIARSLRRTGLRIRDDRWHDRHRPSKGKRRKRRR